MRSLIIPDFHHHTENADYWLGSQSYDRVIFLGDYFDNFGDNVGDARQTAGWLRQRMDATDDVLLLGNHDAAYLFPNLDALYCPGFTKAKARAIHEILTPEALATVQAGARRAGLAAQSRRLSSPLDENTDPETNHRGG